MSSLPVRMAPPRDEMTAGPSMLKFDTAVRHPVEEMQRSFLTDELARERRNLMRVDGRGAVIRAEMERRVLTQFQRLPGLPSAMSGLDTLLGRDMELDAEDLYGDDSVSPHAPKRTLHEQMELALGL
eukprot:PLAT1735.1.p2 GENE.PLAT1735.1~~PLAT1735.1.p2  ORF type:complete len:127 (-),score=42.60 PLAT1735.1:71-451(-)